MNPSQEHFGGASSAPDLRRRFAERMADLELGSTKGKVRESLGSPDTIRSFGQEWGRYEHSAAPRGFEGVEIWGYGLGETDNDLPTLGQVWFSPNDLVMKVYGGVSSRFANGETLPQAINIEESILRSLLRTIDRGSSGWGWSYDPLAVICIVNTLQSLGKEKALGAIQEYLRIAPIQILQHTMVFGGVTLILRSLFDLPPSISSFPAPQLGVPVPSYPQRASYLPRFPVAIVDGIPFNIVAEYWGTAPPSIEADLRFCRENGCLRQLSLTPSSQPFEAMKATYELLCRAHASVDSLDEGLEKNHGATRLMLLRLLANQLARLLRFVYPMPFFPSSPTLSEAGICQQLEHHAEALSHLQLAWDSATHNYVRLSSEQ